MCHVATGVRELRTAAIFLQPSIRRKGEREDVTRACRASRIR
jgi:hypothetical protein